MSTFAERVAKLGVSDNRAYKGVLTVNDLDDLKGVMGDEEHGPQIGAGLFDGIAANNDDYESVLLRRVAQHIYGVANLAAQERAEIDPMFPLRVNLVSLPDKTIDSKWDLNQETGTGPVIVNLGTLTMKQDGYIVISNRTLTFTVDNLVREGDTGVPGMYDFNILGATGDTGPVGTSPNAPGQSTNGSPGECSSGGIAGHGGTAGDCGAPGTGGGTGGKGGDGKPSMPATIKITQGITTASQISIFTSSGAGGDGGPGGNGSKGGQGGDGGNGVTCGCTGNAGAAGGQGGKGGTGGTGGPGGNGVDAWGNVMVFVPAADVGKILPLNGTAPPGHGGAPGTPGAKGDGGAASVGGKHNVGGSAGGQGAEGDPGTWGAAGTVTGKANIPIVQPV